MRFTISLSLREQKKFKRFWDSIFKIACLFCWLFGNHGPFDFKNLTNTYIPFSNKNWKIDFFGQTILSIGELFGQNCPLKNLGDKLWCWVSTKTQLNSLKNQKSYRIISNTVKRAGFCNQFYQLVFFSVLSNWPNGWFGNGWFFYSVSLFWCVLYSYFFSGNKKTWVFQRQQFSLMACLFVDILVSLALSTSKTSIHTPF